MTSFLKLWESMSSGQVQPVDHAADVIRSGIGLNEKFWKEFILVLNNSQGLAELLDVSHDKVSTWHQKIQNKLKEVQAADQNVEVNKNRKIMRTGE